MVEFWRIFRRTNGFMIAIQNHVICNNKFREELETIKRITGTCRALTLGDYTHFHNQVAGVVRQELAIICGLSRGKPTICVRELIS